MFFEKCVHAEKLIIEISGNLEAFTKNRDWQILCCLSLIEMQFTFTKSLPNVNRIGNRARAVGDNIGIYHQFLLIFSCKYIVNN